MLGAVEVVGSPGCFGGEVDINWWGLPVLASKQPASRKQAAGSRVGSSMVSRVRQSGRPPNLVGGYSHSYRLGGKLG